MSRGGKQRFGFSFATAKQALLNDDFYLYVTHLSFSVFEVNSNLST